MRVLIMWEQNDLVHMLMNDHKFTKWDKLNILSVQVLRLLGISTWKMDGWIIMQAFRKKDISKRCLFLDKLQHWKICIWFLFCICAPLPQKVALMCLAVPLRASDVPLHACNMPLHACNVPLHACNVHLCASDVPLHASDVPLHALDVLLYVPLMCTSAWLWCKPLHDSNASLSMHLRCTAICLWCAPPTVLYS